MASRSMSGYLSGQLFHLPRKGSLVHLQIPMSRTGEFPSRSTRGIGGWSAAWPEGCARRAGAHRLRFEHCEVLHAFELSLRPPRSPRA